MIGAEPAGRNISIFEGRKPAKIRSAPLSGLSAYRIPITSTKRVSTKPYEKQTTYLYKIPNAAAQSMTCQTKVQMTICLYEGLNRIMVCGKFYDLVRQLPKRRV